MTNTQPYEIKVALQVLKPADEVFESIVDPEKMKNYFISESNGRMEEGRELNWRFPEFDMDVPVLVGKIEEDKYISYYWDADDKKMLVEIKLSAGKENATLVTITEKSKDGSDTDIKWLKGNTEGWANFLCCLKAYMEHGINLRKGAFDYPKKS